MPSSSLLAAPQIIHLVHTTPNKRRVLDVGPGWGKYATLLREYLDPRPEVIDAVEAWGPYVDAHRLRNLYRKVWACDVRDLTDETLARYDVTLMVDVIEHLPLDDGHALLDRIPGVVVLSTPVAFFQNPPGLPPTETHRSHWTSREFDRVAQTRPIEWQGVVAGQHVLRLGAR